MDLQTRKIELIKNVFYLQNEEIVSRVENLLKNEEKKSELENIKPFSIEELNVRIEKSLKDSKKGNLTEINDLLEEIEKWH
jgi:hypothetical protein